MTLATVLKFLIGSERAILQVATSRGAVFVGLLFVLAAGLAREYDGEDLVSEPWHLLLPLAASLATSLLLYALIQGLLYLRGGHGGGRCLTYREFLSLYWMTAPLALLYGIPVERFLSAADATRANLALLGIVSLWRVLLITRAISVVYQVSFMRALFPVMLFADTVALVLLQLTPLPIVSIMGGIRLSESEALLHSTAFTIGALGFLSWPIWLVGAIAACNSSWRLVNLSELPSSSVARHLCWLSATALLAWLSVLPVTQSEQRLRHQVERQLRTGETREALLLMSAHERSDFPPHWDPPPRLAYRESTPHITEVQEYLDVLPVKDWVRQLFVEKFSNSLRGETWNGIWLDLEPDELERRIGLIERMPEKADLVREHQEQLKWVQDSLPSPLRMRVQKLLEDAGVRSAGDGEDDSKTPSH